ncbi:MAG: hypothetical protein EP301_04760 [Gammaproteobacteria bacterium]|jgi:hypothetical protein|nr:MAG: hypothetical protein EP301_04760 [Gammaproteobacteria bacterium]
MHSLIFSTALIFATIAGQAMANPVACTYGDLSRKIEVVYSNPGQPVPCEVIYDKSAEGTIETLWRASNEAGYCEAQAAELADKLSGMGWQCAADEGSMTDISEEAITETLDG